MFCRSASRLVSRSQELRARRGSRSSARVHCYSQLRSLPPHLQRQDERHATFDHKVQSCFRHSSSQEPQAAAVGREKRQDVSRWHHEVLLPQVAIFRKPENNLNQNVFFFTFSCCWYRLTFTPEGSLLIVPSGCLDRGQGESNEDLVNTTYIFTRNHLSKYSPHAPATYGNNIIT